MTYREELFNAVDEKCGGKTMSQREELFEAVKEYLESQNWKYSSDPEKFRCSYTMTIKGKLNSCKVVVVAEDKGIKFVAISPINVSEENRASVAEYITRANYGLRAGNFEMDYSDGEVRYKNYMRCTDMVPSQEDIEFSNDVCFMMFQQYGDGLVKNMMGFGDPEKDIQEAEAD